MSRGGVGMSQTKEIPLVWVCCPLCGQRLMQARAAACAHGLYIKCRRCRAVVEIQL